MKQLLIVNSNKALNYNIQSANDLSGLSDGAITFFDLETNSLLSSKPTKNFGIALGRKNNSPAFVIPEVDVDTLSVVKTNYSAGVAFVASVTIPTVAPGKTYTIVLVKNGTVPHERNTWTATEKVATNDTTASATTIATKLRKYFEAMADTGSLDISVSGTGAVVTITGKNIGEGWTLKTADDLSGTTVTTTVAKPTIGDAEYVKDLASRCAAGKGFTDTEISGRDIYPGYPEPVEDVHYDIYTLRFKVGRDSSKTRDEKVWQLVHIAVPVTNSSSQAISTILGYSTTPSSSD